MPLETEVWPTSDSGDDGGPSTPRGRGNGRGGGVGGGGGRGRGRGGGGKADYSNVPLDYDRLNKQGYTRMDAYTVAPYGTPSTNTPNGIPRSFDNTPNRGRGTWTPRSRGNPSHGTGTTHRNLTDETPLTSGPSGSATPVRGLGFRAQINSNRGRGSAGLGSGGSYRGKGKENQSVFWGGRGAPLFVKAGELFKEGQVEVITQDEEHELHVETFPLSDPSAPQMDNLQDETEVQVFDFNEFNTLAYQQPQSTLRRSASQAQPVSQPKPPHEVVQPDIDIFESIKPVEAVVEIDEIDVEATDEVLVVQIEESPDIATTPINDDPENEVPTFFIDTAPAEVEGDSSPTYLSTNGIPLGAGSGTSAISEDEKIVFAPKIYEQPEPISITSGSSTRQQPSIPAGAVAALNISMQGITMDPSSSLPLTRKDKKAAKREKRKNRNKKRKSGNGGIKGIMRDDSDMEWGSDGPPPAILGVEGLNPDDDDDDDENGGDDVAILRDYLAGTLLNAKSEMEDLEEERQAARYSLVVDDDEGEEVEANDQDGVSMEDEETEEELELEAMRKFAEGVAGMSGGAGMVLRDNGPDEDTQQDEEGDWESASGSAVTDDEVIKNDSMSIQDEVNVPINAKAKGKGRAKLDSAEFRDPEGYLRKSRPSADSLSGESDDSDASDSEGSSDLGNLDEAILEAMDEEMDTSEEDDFFNGKPTWADETEWFIRDMEDALDGGAPLKDRKQRNKLFRAIETGDFGDDWPTAPVKKGKKNKHVPAELQDVWERDRQKKAEKKRQRELERLLAEIDPRGSIRGGKKGKGKSKAHQASVASRMPGSAAEVAAIFDISSEEEFLRSIEGGGGGVASKGKKRRGMNLLPKTMEEVDEEIKMFLQDHGRSTLALQPMEKEGRRNVHLLAECYGLKSQSKGSGKNRAPILIKTGRTGQNIDSKKINRIISSSMRSGGAFFKATYSKSGGGTKAKGPRGDPGSSVRHRDGDAVGEGAERIGMENIGHRLLSMMGWSEGDRIGKSGGLEAPIVAIVKNTKTGLGA